MFKKFKTYILKIGFHHKILVFRCLLKDPENRKPGFIRCQGYNQQEGTPLDGCGSFCLWLIFHIQPGPVGIYGCNSCRSL